MHTMIRLFIPLLFACALLSACGKSTIAVPGMPQSTSYTGGRQTATELKASVVRIARSQIGTPYRLGGEAPGGFDCSGLIAWTYGRHGIEVPRTTAEQIHMGRRVAKSSLQAGDVLVFRTSAGLHTGIYSGRGTFIHSPRTGAKVREEKLNSAYWNKAYREARRVL